MKINFEELLEKITEKKTESLVEEANIYKKKGSDNQNYANQQGYTNALCDIEDMIRRMEAECSELPY
jgi:7,8-dihydro-6-hydroxymethylpterin-pyrophosphokinase